MQAIHIFCKDTRRCWWQICVLLAMMEMLVILTPDGGSSGVATSPRSGLEMALSILHSALPAGWWFVIAYMLQAERLVGDRQFWVTRPYSWRSLFGAKLLFCAAWLVLPFFVSDCVILVRCGFPLRPLLGGLLAREALLSVWMIVPALLLAGLTRGVREFTAVALMVLFAFLLCMTSQQLLQASNREENILLVGAVIAGVALALLAAQMVWRCALLTRLAAIPLIAGFALWARIPEPEVVGPAKITAEQVLGVGVSLARQSAPNSAVFSSPHGEVRLAVPIEFHGWPHELLTWEANASLSNWQGKAEKSDQGGDWVWFDIDRKSLDFALSHDGGLTLVIDVALYNSVAAAVVKLEGPWVMAPGSGAVRWRGISPDSFLIWRAPLRFRRQGDIYALDVQGQHFRGSGIYGLQYQSSFTHISPLVDWAIMLNPDPTRELDREPRAAGHLTVERFAANLRRELRIDHTKLRDYVLPER